MNQSTTSIPTVVPVATATAPQVVDIPMERPTVGILKRIGVILLGLAVMIAGVFLMVLVRGKSKSPLFFLIPIAANAAVIVGFFALSRVLMRRRARQIAADPLIMPADVVRAIATRKSLTGGILAMHEALRVMVQRGRAGETFRVCPVKMATPVNPIPHSFEVRPLDEADSAFAEVENAMQATDSAGAGRQVTADDLGLRRVKRNVLLRGGPVRLLVPVIFLLRAAFDSYQRGFFVWRFYLWAGILALILFLPHSASLLKGAQWHLVPGGLVLLRRRKKPGGGRLHLFERHGSNLCVFRVWKAQWRIAVADAGESESIVATRKECDLLLRAWLSPVSPPPLEQVAQMIEPEEAAALSPATG